jgi:hypothetical protein
MADSQIQAPDRRERLIALIITFAIASACPLSASAADSGGSTATDTTGKVLKGDVHDAGMLVPSATLIPGSDQKQAAPVQQYAGSEQDKLHPHTPPKGPVPVKKPGDGAGKGTQPPPPPKLWGTASDDERPANTPPAWGQETPVRPAIAPPAAVRLPAPKKPTSITPPDGVMTWQPGHAVKQVKPQVAEPMHFTWAELNAILMNKRSLMPNAAAPPRATGPQPLAAKQLALPHHLPANWNEWYQNVAHAIYQVWQQEQVCPGTATVRTTVFAGQEVDCRIFEFKAAADLKRNASAESFFRDAALKSVNSIDKSAVCQFPADQHPKKVVFDIQLTRLVDGPAGCEVVHTHQNPAMSASQK